MNVESIQTQATEDELSDLRELADAIFAGPALDSLTAPRVALPFDAGLWDTLSVAGLTRLNTPVGLGGSGAGVAETAVVLSVAAAHAAPVPLAENDLLAAWLIECVGLQVPDVPMTAVMGTLNLVETSGSALRATGTLERVPWARDCDSLVVLGEVGNRHVVFTLRMDGAEIAPGGNLAGEPRDAVRFECTLPSSAITDVGNEIPREFLLRGAFARSVQICAALDRAMELTIEHASQRVQFGRSLGKFQAVQHMVASIACEVAAARAALDTAIRIVDADGFATPRAGLTIAIAKSQSARAANLVAKHCHQIHGAIGFTLDHQLRHFTLRVIAWSMEFGDEKTWNRSIGHTVLDAPQGDLWAVMTGVGASL